MPSDDVGAIGRFESVGGNGRRPAALVRSGHLHMPISGPLTGRGVVHGQCLGQVRRPRPRACRGAPSTAFDPRARLDVLKPAPSVMLTPDPMALSARHSCGYCPTASDTHAARRGGDLTTPLGSSPVPVAPASGASSWSTSSPTPTGRPAAAASRSPRARHPTLGRPPPRAGRTAAASHPNRRSGWPRRGLDDRGLRLGRARFAAQFNATSASSAVSGDTLTGPSAPAAGSSFSSSSSATSTARPSSSRTNSRRWRRFRPLLAAPSSLERPL